MSSDARFLKLSESGKHKYAFVMSKQEALVWKYILGYIQPQELRALPPLAYKSEVAHRIVCDMLHNIENEDYEEIYRNLS